MEAIYPITVFYDASCKLCSSEMHSVKLQDIHNRLILVDCSAIDFDDTPYRQDGITREAMMNCMHVINANGDWYKGVDAFELIYTSIGMRLMATLWSHRLTRPLAERAYPLVVRHRHRLSKTGLPLLFRIWGRCAAKRALKRSQLCSEGMCSNQP